MSARPSKAQHHVRTNASKVLSTLKSNWMLPLIVEEERDRLVAWEKAVRYEFNYFIGGFYDSL